MLIDDATTVDTAGRRPGSTRAARTRSPGSTRAFRAEFPRRTGLPVSPLATFAKLLHAAAPTGCRWPAGSG